MQAKDISNHQPLFEFQKRYNQELERATVQFAVNNFVVDQDTFKKYLTLAGNEPNHISWDKDKKVLLYQSDEGEPFNKDKEEEYRTQNLAQRIHDFVRFIFHIETIKPNTFAGELDEYLIAHEEVMRALQGGSLNEYVAQIKEEEPDSPARKLAKAQDELNKLYDHLKSLIEDIQQLPSQKLQKEGPIKKATLATDKLNKMKEELLLWVAKFADVKTLDDCTRLFDDPVTIENWVNGDFAKWEKETEEPIKQLFEERIPQIKVEITHIQKLQEEFPAVVKPNTIVKPPAQPKKPLAKQSWIGSLFSMVTGIFNRVCSFLRWCISFTGLIKS